MDGDYTCTLTFYLFQSQPDYFGGVRGQTKILQFIRREPAHFFGIVRRHSSPAYAAAEKIDEYVMVQSAAGVIAKQAVVHAQEFGWFNAKAGFLAGFPDHGVVQSFSQLQNAPRYGPLTGQWRMPALHQQNPAILNDDRAHTHEG
jgi:hypothetical protein